MSARPEETDLRRADGPGAWMDGGAPSPVRSEDHKRSGPETCAGPLRACSLPRSKQNAHAGQSNDCQVKGVPEG